MALVFSAGQFGLGVAVGVGRGVAVGPGVRVGVGAGAGRDLQAATAITRHINKDMRRVEIILNNIVPRLYHNAFIDRLNLVQF